MSIFVRVHAVFIWIHKNPYFRHIFRIIWLLRFNCFQQRGKCPDAFEDLRRFCIFIFAERVLLLLWKFRTCLNFSLELRKSQDIFFKLKKKLGRHFFHYLRINILFILLAWSVSPSVWGMWSSVFFSFNCKFSRFSGDVVSNISIKREHTEYSLTSLRETEWSWHRLLYRFISKKGKSRKMWDLCSVSSMTWLHWWHSVLGH